MKRSRQRTVTSSRKRHLFEWGRATTLPDDGALHPATLLPPPPSLVPIGRGGLRGLDHLLQCGKVFAHCGTSASRQSGPGPTSAALPSGLAEGDVASVDEDFQLFGEHGVSYLKGVAKE